MQFLNFLALTIGLVSAADICRTTGSGCSGSKVCCSGIQENNCCNLGTAKSSLLWTLPANSRGQAWSGTNCNSGSSATFKNPNKVTDRCVNYNWGVPSAKWLVGGGTKREASPAVEVCDEPNLAVYEVDGVENKVKIPEGEAEVVTQWIDNGEWEKLGGLEKSE